MLLLAGVSFVVQCVLPKTLIECAKHVTIQSVAWQPRNELLAIDFAVLVDVHRLQQPLELFRGQAEPKPAHALLKFMDVYFACNSVAYNSMAAQATVIRGISCRHNRELLCFCTHRCCRGQAHRTYPRRTRSACHTAAARMPRPGR